jgi:hypothetical protein
LTGIESAFPKRVPLLHLIASIECSGHVHVFSSPLKQCFTLFIRARKRFVSTKKYVSLMTYYHFLQASLMNCCWVTTHFWQVAANQMNVKLWNLEMNDSLLSRVIISQRTGINPTSIHGSKSWFLSLSATLQSAAANCQV